MCSHHSEKRTNRLQATCANGRHVHNGHMDMRDNGDKTMSFFNAAGSWIGWARVDDAGGVHLQSTGAPLDQEERRAFEASMAETMRSGKTR
jgi:hypothetical protein